MRVLTLLIVLGTALQVTATESPLPSKDALADAAQLRRLQHVYSQRLYEESLPQLKEESLGKVSQEILPIAQRLWNEVYGPHQSLLKRRVVETLRELDEAAAVEAERYDVIHESNDWPKDAGDLGQYQAMAFWNPVNAAELSKTMLMSKVLAAAEFGKLMMLNSIAHPAWQVADRDPAHPRLVQQMGPELVIVELQRKDDSYYSPSRVRWLRLKQAGRAPNTGERQSPAMPDQLH